MAREEEDLRLVDGRDKLSLEHLSLFSTHIIIINILVVAKSISFKQIRTLGSTAFRDCFSKSWWGTILSYRRVDL